MDNRLKFIDENGNKKPEFSLVNFINLKALKPWRIVLGVGFQNKRGDLRCRHHMIISPNGGLVATATRSNEGIIQLKRVKEVYENA